MSLAMISWLATLSSKLPVENSSLKLGFSPSLLSLPAASEGLPGTGVGACPRTQKGAGVQRWGEIHVVCGVACINPAYQRQEQEAAVAALPERC